MGGIINNTVGVGGFLPFNVSSTTVTGAPAGLVVSAGVVRRGRDRQGNGRQGRPRRRCAYVGGSGAEDGVVEITNIKSVSAKNNAGGFAGVVGPGDLASTGGIDLLGLGALKLNGLLSVADGLEVKMDGVAVAGVPSGMAVEATGNNNADGGTTRFAAAGFAASANSVEVTGRSRKEPCASVSAHLEDGVAGGFVGVSRTGGLADVADETAIKGLLSASNLLNAVGYMIPSYTNVDVSYINGGGVSADMAGGFAGDFQSGTVENQGDPWAVYNIAQVTGGSYAGGFGGRVTSGTLAAADGGVSILGGIADLSIGIDQLLGVMGAYVPSIKNAGVKSDASTVEATSGAVTPDREESWFRCGLGAHGRGLIPGPDLRADISVTARACRFPIATLHSLRHTARSGTCGA
ncbi:MAG: hypothetical protein ACLTSX_03745 [Collinsella sp.]